MGRLERGDRLFPRYGRESVQELVQTVAPLQVVDEIAQGHAGPDENGRSTENVPVAVNN